MSQVCNNMCNICIFVKCESYGTLNEHPNVIIPGNENTKSTKDRDGREEQNTSPSPTLDIRKITIIKNPEI